MRETIKDLDFIIATEEPEIVKEHLLAITGNIRSDCSRRYESIGRLDYEYDISVDFRFVKTRRIYYNTSSFYRFKRS